MYSSMPGASWGYGEAKKHGLKYKDNNPDIDTVLKILTTRVADLLF